jgi:hypothetical protein
MHKEGRKELDVRLKLVVLELANHFGMLTPQTYAYLFQSIGLFGSGINVSG